MITIDILQLIDNLEKVLDAGRASVFSAGRVSIDRDAFLNIVDQMRITIPQEIKKASEVATERDRYIAQAHEEARRIIAQAREDAAKMLDEHTIRQEAQERAAQVMVQAEHEAQRVTAGADAYAENKLRELAVQVDQLQRVIQNGLHIIAQRRPEEVAQASQPPEAARPPRDVDQQGEGS